MKIKTLFTILLALTLLTSTCILPTNAKGNVSNVDVEIIIYEEVSNETKQKIENYFITGEPVTDNVSAYGISCTLFGHKLESSAVEVITHKVRTTAPRCVSKLYNYQACTRCDYETSTLMGTEYIYCCA